MSRVRFQPFLVWLFRLSENPVLRGAVALAIVAIAIVVLHHLSREVSLGELRTDLGAASGHSILLAVLFTALSFVALASYDVISVRDVAPGKVPLPVAAAAGAASFAISNLLGFPYFTGTAARYRVYAGFSLDTTQIANLLALSWSATWLGLLLVVGVLLTFHPDGLGAVIPQLTHFDRASGILLLLLLSAVFLRLLFGRTDLSLFGFRFALPKAPEAVALTGAAAIDICASALALYVLLPADIAPPVPYFFIVYVAAISIGFVSHAPGGLGVFEATVLAGLGAGGRSDALAALVLYRVIYTGGPFLIAVAGLTVAEIRRRRAVIAPVTRITHSIVGPFVPWIASALALASGAILLLSGNLPALGYRIDVLQKGLPLGLVEVSHLAGSVAGVLLLVVARGLFRRLYGAWLVAFVLVVLGFVASLVKGIDYEEASLLFVAAIVLWIFRGSFYRVKGASPFHLGLGWFLSVAALFGALTWVGFFAFKHVEYSNGLWWQISWAGDASRSLRAGLASAVVLAALAFNSIISTRGRRHRPEPIPDAVRKLVAASPDTEAKLALLGDKSFVVDPAERAFLCYADTGKALVSKGDPVGEEEAARRILWQFREMADVEGKRPVFYAVTPKYVPTYLDMGLTVVKFGEVARVDLSGFTLDQGAMRDFRQARNRAEREGYCFEIIPAAELPAVFPSLRQISNAWLARKQGKEKSFALGFFDETYLSNFDHVVLKEKTTSKIVAFANLLQAGGNELSVDLMRYDPAGPKFAMDALFGQLMLWGKEQGFRWFNLGAAPFSGSETHPLASPWQRLGGLLYQHGEEFYHFEGLRSFKEKFHPTWTPNYIACQGGLGVARAFMDANLLISGGFKGLIRKAGSA